MSTKIYDAYKLVAGKSDPWEIIWSIQEEAEANVRAALKALYWDLIIRLKSSEELEAEREKIRSWGTVAPEAVEWKARLRVVTEFVKEEYKKARSSPYRDAFNFDVTLAITPYRRSLYLRAFCDGVSHLRGALDFLNKHPCLKDYHYQNQVDKPRDVSSREWKRREKDWEAMVQPGTGVIRNLALTICDQHNFWRLEPSSTLRAEWDLNPPVLPTPEEVFAIGLRKLKFETIEVESGLITASKDGVGYRIEDGTRVLVDGQLVKQVESLELAYDHIYYLCLPESQKRWVDSFTARHEASKGSK